MLVFLNEVLGVSIDVENVVADKAPYPISILPEGDDWRVLALETETFSDYDIALQLVAAKITR